MRNPRQGLRLVLIALAALLLLTGWLLRDEVLYQPWVYKVRFVWGREGVEWHEMIWSSDGQHEGPEMMGLYARPQIRRTDACDALSAFLEADYDDRFAPEEFVEVRQVSQAWNGAGTFYYRVRYPRWDCPVPYKQEAVSAEDFRAAVLWK